MTIILEKITGARKTNRDGRVFLTMAITIAFMRFLLLVLYSNISVTGASIRAASNGQREEKFPNKNDGRNREVLLPTTETGNRSTFDLLTCPADITLHDSRLTSEADNVGHSGGAIRDGKEFFEKYLTDHHFSSNKEDRTRHTTTFGALSDSMMKYGTNNVRQHLLTIQSEGKFTFWGLNIVRTSRSSEPDVHLQMSLFQSDITSDGTLVTPDKVLIKHVEHEGYRWDLIPPKEEKLKIASQKIVILPEGPKEYIVFASVWHNAYQHVLIDHLGWLEYLKEAYPEANILLLGKRSKGIMYVIDHEFMHSRITYLNCGMFEGCSDKIIQAPKGTALSMFMPPVSTRNIELYDNARRWIWSSSILSQWRQQLADNHTQRTIIYYRRCKEGRANKERIMNEKQEDIILQMIEHSMKRFNRLEQLVIFDGTNSNFEYQLKLFASSSIVIGPHGGALANLLFSPQVVNNCKERTKLIEFVQSSETPKVQPGSYDKTYYYLFSTMPWIETHQVFYVPPSDKHETYIDLQSFHDALNSVMSGDENESRHSVSLTPNFRNMIKG